MAEPRPDIGEDAILLQPVFETGAKFYVVVTVLLAVIAWAVFTYVLQVKRGLGITGLNRPVMWGFYITNFVFFIGISHAGTLISAILRLCHAEWRRAITRSAEVITVLVLFIGMSNIIIDLGRPDRVLYVIQHGHLRSPLLWDVISVTAYLTGSTIYLYLPLIPDIALIRDRTTKRRWFYRLLALGWQGTEWQHRWLNRGIAVMAVLVIPIAVSVHTVVSWVFGMTIQPMWHSTIFGPYFVVGAIFSGIAALIIAMAVLRWAYHLEDYIRPVHFNNLAILLLVMLYVTQAFTVQQKTYVVVDQVTEAQQNLRAISDLVDRDVRLAGFMVPAHAAVCGHDATSGPDRLYLSNADAIRSVFALEGGNENLAGDYGAPVSGVNSTWTRSGATASIALTRTWVDVAADGIDFAVSAGVILADRRSPNAVVACGTITAITGNTLTVDLGSTSIGPVGLNADVVAVPAHVYSLTPAGAGTPAQLFRDGMLIASDDEPPRPEPAGASHRVESFRKRRGWKKRTHSATRGRLVPAGG